ncbi:MAG: hypothetical protein HDT30_10395 [Clostridiales bacterium]|nr:hypothetical protein [Clostridiales bacterium]MDE7422431.1 hypothetical protein [Lachnospiraceae bacterium]
MSKTKIVVIQRKELIYTGIFLVLGIFLIVLLIFMLHKDEDGDSSPVAEYTPGVYTSQLSLNDTLLNIEVVVDSNHINGVTFSNIDDSVSAMYPLLEPTLANIENQLCNNVAIDQIVLEEESKYTQQLLLNAIEETLEKAKN